MSTRPSRYDAPPTNRTSPSARGGDGGRGGVGGGEDGGRGYGSEGGEGGSSHSPSWLTGPTCEPGTQLQ